MKFVLRNIPAAGGLIVLNVHYLDACGDACVGNLHKQSDIRSVNGLEPLLERATRQETFFNSSIDLLGEHAAFSLSASDV